MKVYLAEHQNKGEIEALSKAVREAGLHDFSFARDVEHYKHTFDDPQERWDKVRDELTACEALLIDVSEHPGDGQMVEVGMAYATRKPVIVVKRADKEHDVAFDGVAEAIIEYTDYKDLAHKLKRYDRDRNFNVTDKTSLLAMLLLLGVLISWGLGQIFIPLGVVAAIPYWFVVRWVLPSMKVFDRVVIYIPLIAAWATGVYVLMPVYMPLALAWLIGYWIVVLLILKKLKFSLQ